MLEKLKPGDLCILSDGDQAVVNRVEITAAGRYDLCFNIPVRGKIKGPKATWWAYEPDGTLAYLPGNTCIHIVKIIAE